jgi:aspartyl aminopeptidase
VADTTGANTIEDLRKHLFKTDVRVCERLASEEKDRVLEYAEGYRHFLNSCRTERRAVRFFREQAIESGFVDLGELSGAPVKVFLVHRHKLMAMAIVGRKPLTEGIRIVASHLDSPRLDLKPNPLYEDEHTGLALLKTHYYGGIKKYQWVARSLALCGTVMRADDTTIDVEIGLDPAGPVLTIPDLLPHLARKQMEQKASEFIPAENLNVIVGASPYPGDEGKERTKLAILQWLEREYQLTEEDFTSAEIQVVPAEQARDAGLDGSLIAGYGQDDRICAYTSFTAALETLDPQHTSVLIFFDKEEVGSEGNTGAQSRFVDVFLMDLLEKTGLEPSFRNLQRTLLKSKAISADVTAAYDPTYPEVYEKRNNARLGYGINLTKYTGSAGKALASDASAEYVGWVRNLFKRNGIDWQAAASGKVDEGGGGTVAKFLAKRGLDVVDSGPPILGMHSPVEVSSKYDLWTCHRAFSVFLSS